MEALTALEDARAKIEELPFRERKEAEAMLDTLAPELERAYREPALQERAQRLKNLDERTEQVADVRRQISQGLRPPRTAAGKEWMRKELGPMGGRFMDFQSALSNVRTEAGQIDQAALDQALELGTQVAGDFETALESRGELDGLRDTLDELQELRAHGDTPKWGSWFGRLRSLLQPPSSATGSRADDWQSLVGGLEELEAKLEPFTVGDRWEIQGNFHDAAARRRAVLELKAAAQKARGRRGARRRDGDAPPEGAIRHRRPRAHPAVQPLLRRGLILPRSGAVLTSPPP